MKTTAEPLSILQTDDKATSQIRIVAALSVMSDERVILNAYDEHNAIGASLMAKVNNLAEVYETASAYDATVVLIDHMLGRGRDSGELLVTTIHQLRHHPEHPIVVIGVAYEPAWAKTFIEAGASGTINGPITPQEIERLNAMLPSLLQQAYQERISPNYINHFTESAVRAIESGEWERGMFAVWSPKGGVGKSFIAREMAVALGVLCHRNVLLIDADMTCGDQAVYLGLSAERGGIYKLAQLYSANRKLTPALLQQCLVTYNPSSKSGSSLKVLTGAYRMSMSGDPTFVGQQGYNFANALLDVLDVMNYDFVIFDLGQSFHHPIHLTALRKCDYTFVITTSEKAAAIELAYALPELRKGMDLEREKFRLIINKWDDAMGIVPRELIDTLRIPEFARIPFEEAREVSLSLNHSKPLMLETPGKVSDAIANALIGVFPSMETVWRSRGGSGGKQKKGLFSFGKSKLTLGRA